MALEEERKAHAMTIQQLFEARAQLDQSEMQIKVAKTCIASMTLPKKYSGQHELRIRIDLEQGEVSQVVLLPETDVDQG